MEKKQICLDGKWQMTWCGIGAGDPDIFENTRSLPYTVPGDVHTPLIDAGIIPEPLIGLNSRECTWVEEQEFWCRRAFRLEEADFRSNMELTFEGLDCTADIYLNGHHIGSHNNAFVEVTFEVTQRLRIGENTLLVRIDQGLREARTHDLERMGMMWNNDQPYRVWMRKPQFVYGWDWTIWLATCGIWKSVYLNAYSSAKIADLYVRPASKTVREGTDCDIAVSLDVKQNGRVPYHVTFRVDDREGNAVIETVLPGNAAGELTLTVPKAHLWWCNGMGEAYLYTLTVTLTQDDGTVLDAWSQKFGIRTIELMEPEMDDGETGFTFLLNSEPVFCKGANHVPCDCLPGRMTEEKERQLIALAKEENMNMLRVWGGGVYSSEAFMDACDEAGIMVWHDFMYACGYYPDHDPLFVENITEEARKAILRLRRHTSLIGWAGNNEIQEMYLSQKQWNPDLPWYGGTIYEKILPALTEELCPELIYRESSPHGGQHQADGRHGDQHIWLLTHIHDHPHYLDLWRFTEFKVKFLSEFGIMGAMTTEMAECCIPAENMRPDDPVWMHHTNFCQDGTLLDAMVKRYFGNRELDYKQYILHSQVIQAELTRHIYEEFRRQKFVCSGLLFWTLSDSYGIHNWSLIDYSLRRKPVYYALKQAMAPAALSIRGWDVQNDEGEKMWRTHWNDSADVLEIWGMNDTREDICGKLEWCIMTVRGDVLRGAALDVRIGANRSEKIADVSVENLKIVPEQTLLRARLLCGGTVVNETKYFFAPFREMAADHAEVKVECAALDEAHYELSLTADCFVWLLHIDEPDGVACDENDFSLWPGETRKVVVAAGPEYAPSVNWLKQEDNK